MDEEAVLIVITNGKDADGFPVETETEYSVFVHEKSLTRAEFYETYRSGISAKMILEMRPEDWEQSAHIVNNKKEYATRIKYDGCIYEVVRAYKTTKSKIEVTCG